MALKSRLRRALGRGSPDSTRSSSTSSSASTSQMNLSSTLSSSPSSILSPVLTKTPTNLPLITLTKTSSRLQKITSWRREKKWEEQKSKYSRADPRCQELLGGWEMSFGGRGSMDGRSVWGGVSPMGSRCVSLDMVRGKVEEVERVEVEEA